MEPLNVSIEDCPDHPLCHIVHFVGEFDGYAKESIAGVQELVDNAKDGTMLVFNFEKLNYMNSYAIGHLIAWRNTLSQSNSHLFIAGTTSTVQDALDAVGTNVLFTFYPDVDTAVQQIHQ